MSLLDFPAEVKIQFIRKCSVANRITLSTAHPRVLPLCFDRTLNPKTVGTITLAQLHEVYKHAKTKEEKIQCFLPRILNRLSINNFSEIVDMAMNSECKEFFLVNHKLFLQTLKGKIVLDGEKRHFSKEFFDKFLSLLDKVEGNVLLIFMNIISYESMNLKRFKRVMMKKFTLREKVYYIDVDKTYAKRQIYHIDEVGTPVYESIISLRNYFTFFYESYVVYYNGDINFTCDPVEDMLCRFTDVHVEKENKMVHTHAVIQMLNGKSLEKVRQKIVNVSKEIARLQLADISWGSCDDCNVWHKLPIKRINPDKNTPRIPERFGGWYRLPRPVKLRCHCEYNMYNL